jgi:hypothetical protein
MPIVLDGNNLLHTQPRGSRADVRRQALELVRGGGMTITVVFDGPPSKGSPSIEHLGRVTVRYSGQESADDAIVGLLPRDRSAAEWMVVTDDRELGRRVKDRGGQVRTLAEWRRRKVRPDRRPQRESKLSSHDIADWEAFFSSAKDDSEG